MNPKEEAALKKCSERIKKDLDPTYSFLHTMTIRDIITHEEMETVMALGPREAKVAKLLTILPRRGPNAFTQFKNLLEADYNWLAELLQIAVQTQSKKLADEQTHKNLVKVINRQLVPLVLSGNFKYADDKDPMPQTITKVGYLTTMLEQKVYKALNFTQTPKKTVSIEKLIEMKLNENKSVESLNTEIVDLKKKLKSEERSKKEVENLRITVENMKKKAKDHQKHTKKYNTDIATLKRKNEKLSKEMEALQIENQRLKKEMESIKSGCDIQEMF
ncbi:hypothetical protein ACF0H5_022727 [Mactra antiquata]